VISGETVTQTVTLGSGYGSPLTIASTGGVNAGNAIFGPANNSWTVTSQGTVIATGAFGIGIDLLAGGLVVNGLNGGAAVAANAAAALQGWGSNTAAAASNLGASGAAGALITGTLIGVEISGGAGTVVNYGAIVGTSLFGVHLYAGGIIINGAAGAPAALITGGDSGINITGAAGTVNNFGAIEATGATGVGVFLDLGGNIANQAGALISGGADGIMLFDGTGTVTNLGTVSGVGQSGGGIDLDLGGVIVNGAAGALAGLVSGAVGIAVYGAAGAVTNYGTIAGAAGAGIYLGAGGQIVNFGTISGENGTAIDFGQVGGNAVVIEAGSVLEGAIANFQPGDTLDLPFLSFSSAGTVALGVNNVLNVTEPGGSFAIALDPAQSFAGDVFHLANDGNGGTLITEDPPGAGNLALLGQFAAAGFAPAADQGSGAVASYVLTHATPSAPPVLTIPDH